MANFAKKKVFKLAKGFRGRAKNCWTLALRRVHRKLQLQYKVRKILRRQYKRQWNAAISGNVRNYGLNYSRFICGLRRTNIGLDRKILADLAQYEPYSFQAIVEEVSRQVELPRFKECQISFEDAMKEPQKHLFLGSGEGVERPIEPPYEFMRLINEERDQPKDIYRVSRKSQEEDKEWEKKKLARMYTKAEMKRIPNEAFDDNWEEEFDIMKKF